eukprot:scpid38782/ scgid14236/ 
MEDGSDDNVYALAGSSNELGAAPSRHSEPFAPDLYPTPSTKDHDLAGDDGTYGTYGDFSHIHAGNTAVCDVPSFQSNFPVVSCSAPVQQDNSIYDVCVPVASKTSQHHTGLHHLTSANALEHNSTISNSALESFPSSFSSLSNSDLAEDNTYYIDDDEYMDMSAVRPNASTGIAITTAATTLSSAASRDSLPMSAEADKYAVPNRKMARQTVRSTLSLPTGVSISCCNASGSPVVQDDTDTTSKEAKTAGRKAQPGNESKFFLRFRKKKVLKSTQSMHSRLHKSLSAAQDLQAMQRMAKSADSLAMVEEASRAAFEILAVDDSAVTMRDRTRSCQAKIGEMSSRHVVVRTQPEEELTATGLHLVQSAHQDTEVIVEGDSGTPVASRRRMTGGFLRSSKKPSPETAAQSQASWTATKQSFLQDMASHDNSVVSKWAQDDYTRATFFPLSEPWRRHYTRGDMRRK